ncbi:macrophage mannose receptor 1 precursor [Aphelenchoides avenae]|nr:macrophage mannose receptor 1 precursor [Aphelenchus avenae]
MAIHRSGTWIVTDCSQPASYLCRVPPITVPAVDVPTTTPLPSICANERWTYVPETQRCYRPMKSVDTWSGQFWACMDANGTLASIHNPQAAIAIEQLVLNQGTYLAKKKGYFVGLHDPLGIGLWQWADGTAYDYENGRRRSRPAPASACWLPPGPTSTIP